MKLLDTIAAAFVVVLAGVLYAVPELPREAVRFVKDISKGIP